MICAFAKAAVRDAHSPLPHTIFSGSRQAGAGRQRTLVMIVVRPLPSCVRLCSDLAASTQGEMGWALCLEPEARGHGWPCEPVGMGEKESVPSLGGLFYLPRRLALGQFLSLPTWAHLLAGDCPFLGCGDIMRGLGASVWELPVQ